jgi:putative oxidoreductase
VAQEEQMKQTSNIEHRTSYIEPPSDVTSSGVWRVLARILDFVLAAVFIFAGLAKIFDLDHVIADFQYLRFGDALVHLRQLSFANPVEFANGIDNYKILPWLLSVALAFYLPWLEIFCGLGLVFRRFYGGALSILTALVVIFLAATIAAKVRGLDITCGCFGHASQHWNFSAHLGLDLVLFGLVIFLLRGCRRDFTLSER